MADRLFHQASRGIKAAPVQFAILVGIRLQAGQCGIGKGAAFYLGSLHFGLYPLGSIIDRGAQGDTRRDSQKQESPHEAGFLR